MNENDYDDDGDDGNEVAAATGRSTGGEDAYSDEMRGNVETAILGLVFAQAVEQRAHRYRLPGARPLREDQWE